MKFQKIGFIGLGLIGGSIAKAIKTKYPESQLIATAHHSETITLAHQMSLIENEELLPLSSFSACDIIFLCAPVKQNVAYLKELKEIISSDCLLTDVGSVKSDIHTAVQSLGLNSRFIGGHPMCGSEKTGLENASEYLLENAYYILTPTSDISPEKAHAFQKYIASLGALPLLLEHKAHDYATAAISHLPHVIAASLVNLVSELDDENDTMQTIAAGGFKDITRIASSSPVMWQNICLSNREPVLELIDKYIQSLHNIRSSIAAENGTDIMDFFQSAKDYRDSLNVTTRFFNSYVLYCDIRDEAGAIATLSTIMASHNINIKNIGIVHNREFEDGVLQIEYYDSESLEKAKTLLTHHHYLVYTR